MNKGDRRGFHVEGLTEVVANTADDVMGIFVKGSQNRKVGFDKALFVALNPKDPNHLARFFVPPPIVFLLREPRHQATC